MNRSLRLFAVTVSAVMGLAWSAGAFNVGNTFEAYPGAPDWSATGQSIVSDPRTGSAGTYSLRSTGSILFEPTGVNPARNAGQVVSTDFWTKPVLRPAGAPAPDTVAGAKAQFWVDSSGRWNTRSGTVGDASHDAVTVSADTWYHVCVQLDYTKQKWSLNVTDPTDANKLVLLVDNLDFINKVDPSVFRSFEVKSEGNAAVYLDDAVVANNTVPSGLPDPTLPAAVATTINQGNSVMNLTFTPPVQVGVKYQALGGTSPTTLNDPILYSGTAISVPMATRNSYFYQIQAISELDTSKTTSSGIYACYKEDRSGTKRWYYSGVPVNIADVGDDLKVKGLVGQQLAQGLMGGTLTTGDLLILNDGQTFAFNGTVWVPDGTTGATTETKLLPGSGVVIRRKSVSSTGLALLVGPWTANAVTIPLRDREWNYISRPYDTASGAEADGTTAKTSCGFPNGGQRGDLFVVQRGSLGGSVMAKCTSAGKWLKITSQPLGSGDWPQGGEGFLYYNSGANTSYTPTR